MSREHQNLSLSWSPSQPCRAPLETEGSWESQHTVLSCSELAVESRGKTTAVDGRVVREGRVGRGEVERTEGADLTGLNQGEAWSAENFKTHFHSCVENRPRRLAKRLLQGPGERLGSP